MTRTATLAFSIGLVTALHAQQVLFEETFEGASPAFSLNTNDQETSIDLARYQERTGKFTSGRNVLTGAEASLGTALKLPAKSLTVMELK